ncbi:MAG: hypothetical protein JNK76_03650 [Planctomycetales bacterium]|nr:hypothetical protein [Planctomycetales bacterium]MBN8628487.1 hypothetical protein [Planctomycetota bacterium]
MSRTCLTTTALAAASLGAILVVGGYCGAEEIATAPGRTPSARDTFEQLPSVRPTVVRPDRLQDDGLARIQLSGVRSPHGNSPATSEGPTTAREERAVDVVVQWVPPNQRHLPVYFEDVAVERYGQTICPLAQPVISGGKFFTQAALLPYQMGFDAPGRLSYDAGLARPGSPTPYVREHWPLSARGAIYQGAAATGLIFFVSP